MILPFLTAMGISHDYQNGWLIKLGAKVPAATEGRFRRFLTPPQVTGRLFRKDYEWVRDAGPLLQVWIDRILCQRLGLL